MKNNPYENISRRAAGYTLVTAAGLLAGAGMASTCERIARLAGKTQPPLFPQRDRVRLPNGNLPPVTPNR